MRGFRGVPVLAYSRYREVAQVSDTTAAALLTLPIIQGMKDRARWVTCTTLAVLAWIAIHPRFASPTGAADTSPLAWGASDPTWSPDGARLAFSLFGSLWTVAANGGDATQLTTSRGFHEHASWSPDGASVAFIRGENPRGRFAKVSGELVIVDVATGWERTVRLPYRTAGTPDWSADGESIYCALQVPGAGALLAAVDPMSGDSRMLHARP